jgi:hypothetical protein
MRYLIAEDFDGQQVPCLFPDRVTHADMREQLPYTRILAAGDIVLRDGVFVCSGGDAELNLFTRPDDAAVIAGFFAGRPPREEQ